MKAIIHKSEFVKEFQTKYGKLFSHRITYGDDNKTAMYSSKSKDQKFFVPGQEAEFEELEKSYQKDGEEKKFMTIKPSTEYGKRNSKYGQALNREQSRYSGFALSYAKDLVVAGMIDIKDIEKTSKRFHTHMVDLDKSLEA